MRSLKHIGDKRNLLKHWLTLFQYISLVVHYISPCPTNSSSFMKYGTELILSNIINKKSRPLKPSEVCGMVGYIARRKAGVVFTYEHFIRRTPSEDAGTS